jgi:hypothetical protein
MPIFGLPANPQTRKLYQPVNGSGQAWCPSRQKEGVKAQTVSQSDKMFRQKQLSGATFAITLGFLLLGSAPKAQTQVEDDFARLRKLSDSVVTVIAQAILKKDSALLSSAFVDDVDVVMPGRIPHKGKASFMKYAPLLFEKAGGWKLTTTIQKVERSPAAKGWLKETGKYELAEPTEKEPGQVWKGTYLASWRPHENTWILNSLYLSKK